jgi:hypothetical protein
LAPPLNKDKKTTQRKEASNGQTQVQDTIRQQRTIKIELYRDGEPFAVLDKLQSIVSIPTAISFSNEKNTSRCPDGDWWGQDVLLTVTIGGVATTRWLKFRDDS